MRGDAGGMTCLHRSMRQRDRRVCRSGRGSSFHGFRVDCYYCCCWDSNTFSKLIVCAASLNICHLHICRAHVLHISRSEQTIGAAFHGFLCCPTSV